MQGCSREDGSRMDAGGEGGNGGMHGQMDIYDFMWERPGEAEEDGAAHPEGDGGTLLARLFGRLNDPVSGCASCLCSYCVNNAGELYRHVEQGECREACFNCDGCREYSGEPGGRDKGVEDCGRFSISGYGTERVRKRFHVVKSQGKMWNC